MYSNEETILAFNQLKLDPENLQLEHNLILLHMKLVNGMAYNFCKRRDIHHEIEEYECVGYYNLVIGVKNSVKYASDDIEQDITKYLVFYIRQAYIRYFMMNKIMAMPTRTYYKYFQDGRADLLKAVKIESLMGNMTETQIDDRMLLIEVEDILPSLFDRQVLYLKMSGCSEPEISVLLGTDFKSVKASRDYIRTAYKEYLE